MDNKKIVAVSVLAVLALAFAGYGYADYTASTYNSGNYITTEYITLEPVSFDAMAGEDLDKIDMNTWTYYDQGPKTIWALDGDSEEASDAMVEAAGFTVGQDEKVRAVTVGNSLEIEVDTSAGSAQTYNLTLQVLGEVEFGEKCSVLMKITVGQTDSYIDITNPEAVEVAAGTESITVQLIFLVHYDVVMTTFPGIDSQPGSSTEPADAGAVLDGVDFIFKLAPQA